MNEEMQNETHNMQDNSKNVWILVVSIIFTALIVGIGVYFLQSINIKNIEKRMQTQNQELQSKIEEIKDILETKQVIIQTENSGDLLQKQIKTTQQNLPEFNTTDEYVLIMDDYKTSRPSGLIRAKFGSGVDINIGLDGVAHSVFVLVEPDWNENGNLDDTMVFYLELNGDPNIVKYYGPFQGKVLQLLQ
ncbi:MAG: hypothetical protein L3J07_00330 [Candidatus Magasanikbacteria bacterium]|nr:hypothetical protein [Candidatus Magasanikbacteria bacterium]